MNELEPGWGFEKHRIEGDARKQPMLVSRIFKK